MSELSMNVITNRGKYEPEKIQFSSHN